MKLWLFWDPGDYIYAEAGLRGTWTAPEEGPQRRIQPLVIEWEPGSDLVGDFTFPGFHSAILVSERAGKALLSRFRGFELGPVEMVQDPKLKRPKRPTRRTKPRVWLPYQGPPLYDLWASAWVDFDRERSSVRVVGQDPHTGKMLYDVEGTESWHVDVDPATYEVVETRTPRVAGKGLYVAERALHGADVFHIRGFDAVFCTDRVKVFIEESGFTNVSFNEEGDVF